MLEKRYCTYCAFEGDAATAECPSCGESRAFPREVQASHVAFVINELRQPPVTNVVGRSQRLLLETHYEQRLRRLLGAAPAEELPPPPPPPPPAEVPSRRAAEPEREPRRQRERVFAPRPPREPVDWSWLAEQQANLFLFAGAFLTVVAALIFVGYSGQAVGGGLKMALLTVYTLAFLAAGVGCMRMPRVAAAGRVFFAIGAVLVPMNFVAARTILGGENLSRESLWFWGAFATAGFYFAVAYAGLGRMYAFGSGVALVSGVAAACVVGDVSIEWTPVIFAAVALPMVLTQISGNTTLRTRIGSIWAPQSNAVALAAAVFAVLLIRYVIDERSAGARWYLPATFAMFTLYAAVPMLATRRQYYGLGALAGFVGLCAAAVFAIDRPVEWYVVAMAAVALLLGLMLVAIDDERVARRLPDKAAEFVYGAALLSMGVAALIALSVIEAAAQDVDPYEPQTRWFLVAAFALVLAFQGIDAFVRRHRPGVTGTLVSMTGAFAAVVYAVDASGEYYAFAFIAGGAVAVAAARWLASVLPGRFERISLRGDAGMVALAVLPVGIAVALGAVLASAGESSYAPDTRWFLLAVLAIACATYTAHVTMREQVLGEADRVATYGFGATLIGAAMSLVYALDVNPEYYGFAAVAGAAMLLAAIVLVLPRLIGERGWLREDGLTVVHAGTAVAAGIMIVATLVDSASTSAAEYHLQSRWLLPGLFGVLAAFYAVMATVRAQKLPESGAVACAGAVASVFGVTMGIVYALDVSAEYFAFAALAPAIALGTAVHARFPEWIARHLPARWADGAIIAGRAGATAGVAVAAGAVIASLGAEATYAPQSHVFLPLALLCCVAFLALDAARERSLELSVVFLAAVGATLVSVPYAAHAGLAWYGFAFASTGLLFGFGGRAWLPGWIDPRARDGLAVIAITAGWFSFEPAYGDAPRLGAIVHFSAALLYAAAAITDRSDATLGSFFDPPAARRVRLAMGWFYAAGLTAMIGYLYLLRSLSTGEGAGSGSLALPLMAAAIAFAVGGAIVRRWRAEFAPHFYLMSLFVALASLVTPGDARVLAMLLTVYVALYVATAIYEDAPLVLAPAALFGFAAVPAWRADVGASAAVIPMIYSAVSLAAYSAAVAVRNRPRWSNAARVTGALYGLVAPAAGAGLLAASDDEPLRTSALYEWSTVSVAVTGAIGLAEAWLSRRSWMIVPASAVLTIALLLQIGRLNPANVQAYTAIIGAYLVLLGAFGLSRLRLIPQLAGDAQYVEALGAATIMLPSFVQSIGGGWHYEVILLAEASVFLAVGVAIRRRGIVAAAILALVLAAGRVLFDAVNALPNWVVVMLAGLVLLGIGVGILAGRERWAKWQDAMLAWWGEVNGEPAAHQ